MKARILVLLAVLAAVAVALVVVATRPASEATVVGEDVSPVEQPEDPRDPAGDPPGSAEDEEDEPAPDDDEPSADPPRHSAPRPPGGSAPQGPTGPQGPQNPHGPSLPASVTWDTAAERFTLVGDRLEVAFTYGAGVLLESLLVDDRPVATPAPATRITLPGGSVVTSADASDVEVAPTADGMSVSFTMAVTGGVVSETWDLEMDGDGLRWDIERVIDTSAELGIESAAVVFAAEAWENVRRPGDGGNVPVGGPQLRAAAAEFTAIDGLGRNGILLESAPNHAVFDVAEMVFLTSQSESGVSIGIDADHTVASLLEREGAVGADAGLRSGWHLADGALAYTSGNPAGYDSRFSQTAGELLLEPRSHAAGDRQSATISISAVAREDYYDGVQLAGFDNDMLAALVNDFGRTIVQGSDIGASSERSFRAGEAPAFTSPWNVWALELIQDSAAFASMRSQIEDIVALPKRDPADVNAPVGGVLGGLQDADGRIHCCQPFGTLNEAQPTYATTDSVFNLVFATATLYNLDPDPAWLAGVADDMRLALEYAERELLIRSGPTEGLFANSQCADPQSATGCFIDWSEWNDQYDIGQVSAYHNVFAYAALTRWAELEREVLAEPARADDYEDLADGVRARYNSAASAGGFWSSATDSYAYTRTADGAIAKDCSHLFANGYAIQFGLTDTQARDLTVGFSLREQYAHLEQVGHVYDHGAHGGTDYRWRIHGSNPTSCGSGETLENGWPRMYFPFFEDGGGHLLNEQPAAQVALTTGDLATNVEYARRIVERYELDHFMGWSNIQPDTLLPRRDIWQEPFMVNNVLGVWPLYHDVLGFQPRFDGLDILPAIDESLVGSSVDYRLRGDEPVSVDYLGVSEFRISAQTSTPVRVGWQRLPGETATLEVDGSPRPVAADAEGIVWADIQPGSHVYALTGSRGIAYDDSAFTFDAAWWEAPGELFAGGSIRGTSAADATATVRFTGTGAAVLAYLGADKGLATVRLDGVEIGPGDWYAEEGTALARPIVVEGLVPGDHVLEIVVRGDRSAGSSGDQVTIDGVVVFDGGLTPPDPDAPTEAAVHPGLLTYSAGWWAVADPAFLLGELRGTSQTGATVSHTFTGTGVSISGSTGGDKGLARVEIDGVEVGIVDWYSTSPGHRVELFTVDGLTAGQHTITVTVLGEASPGSVGTQVNLDAVIVRTGAW